jgi:hypothetical protein
MHKEDHQQQSIVNKYNQMETLLLDILSILFNQISTGQTMSELAVLLLQGGAIVLYTAVESF